ncbi:MAG: amidohydrolase [Sphingobium sp.]|nr:amidohydrolase [Sphingobium sp.]
MSEKHDNLRIIATEEAFATPAQMAAIQQLVSAHTGYDADLNLWRRMAGGGILTDRLLDLEGERIAIMDAAGIDMHLLSLTSTGVQMFAADKAIAIAQDANDLMLGAIERNLTRFTGLATVPPQAPAEAVKEIERVVIGRGLNGVVINSHTDDEFLSEEKYWPILEAIEASGKPLYLHPRAPNRHMIAAYRPDELEYAIWGYAAETGLHGLRLITSGVFERFPKLKVVLGHMGESIPYWLYRIDYMHRMTGEWEESHRKKLSLTPGETFRRNFAITTSGMNWDPPLKFNIEVLGADNVMFAVDYPYQETHEAADWIRAADIPDDVRRKVAATNAERLFKIATPV